MKKLDFGTQKMETKEEEKTSEENKPVGFSVSIGDVVEQNDDGAPYFSYGIYVKYGNEVFLSSYRYSELDVFHKKVSNVEPEIFTFAN